MPWTWFVHSQCVLSFASAPSAPCCLTLSVPSIQVTNAGHYIGKPLHSNQYSLTEYYSPVHKGEVQLPAIYFLYDLSPIMVAVKDARGGLAHLLVRICAVVGGVFAITGELYSGIR